MSPALCGEGTWQIDDGLSTMTRFRSVYHLGGPTLNMTASIECSPVRAFKGCMMRIIDPVPDRFPVTEWSHTGTAER